MIPQDYSKTRPDIASIVGTAVINGLMAAKEYARTRPRPLPAAQREMLDDNFPRLPDGDGAKRLTEEEFMQLRSSMRDVAGDRKARSIANLREQLAEYHSMLDKLSSVTARCKTLEKTARRRGRRIRALEQEVTALRRSHQGATHVVEDDDLRRKVSHEGLPLREQGDNGGYEQPSLQAPIMHTIQDTSNSPTLFHPGLPSAQHQRQATSTHDGSFHDIHNSSMEPCHAPSHLCDTNEVLRPGRHISPAPSPTTAHVPSEGSIHQTVTSTNHRSATGVDYNFSYNQDGDPSDISPKRKTGYRYDATSSSSGVMSHQQQDAKRFKSDVSPTLEFVDAFQSSSISHQRLLDTNRKLLLMSSYYLS